MIANAIDFREILKPGEGIVIGQACAEPVTLFEELLSQCSVSSDSTSKLSVFLAASFSGLLKAEHAAAFNFSSYGAIGDNAILAKSGRLDVFPVHYSRVTELFDHGVIKSDVVLLQLSRDQDGSLNMGAAHDFNLVAARRARIIIAEVNAQAPVVRGAELPSTIKIDQIIHSDRPMVQVCSPPPSTPAMKIAEYVAELIPNGATLQMGVGSVMSAICDALQSHRDLGVHSGIITDGIAKLMKVGAVNNSRKRVYAGETVGGSLLGSQELFGFAHRNPHIRLVSTAETHGAASLSMQDRFCSVNSAIEVDLTGQINAEASQGRYIGAVGGQMDFVRAASMSERGMSIIVLPSTASNGRISRIVDSFVSGAPITTPRADVDYVVTEWGIAALRNRSLGQRLKAMIDIAHPSFRDVLMHRARTSQIFQ